MSGSYESYKRQRAEKSSYRAPKKPQKQSKFFTYLKSFILIFSALAIAGIIALELYLSSLPPIDNLREDYRPNIVTKFYSGDGEIIKTFTAYSYDRIKLKDVPQDLINAIIATEDKNFYHHHGYDLLGIFRSSIQNVIAMRTVQGASTITQQLARILFLSNERTFTRKIKELEVATRIEKTISKDTILEMYLNNVYLGSGAYGVAAASKIYFNKRLNQLTLPELAMIAGLPQAPSVYNPYNSIDLAKKRRNQVLKRMLAMKYITKDQYDSATKAEIHLSTLPQLYTTNKAPYFSDFVMREMESLGFNETDVIHGGYKVITTLDSKAQKKANEAILSNMRAYGLTRKSQQAAVFSFSPIDGKILVFAGGKNYGESQYDRVTQAIRPPGSAFKPIVYAAAMEKGFSPNDIVDDSPVTIAKWSPHNYGKRYRGKIPLYKALMISSNVCAARIIREVGVHSVIQLARALGITTPLEKDYTIALGSNGVKLYEFVRAYGAFANGGYVVEPYAIERIEDSRGRVVYRASGTKSSHQLSTNTAAEMTAMMKTVITSGTGRGANIGKPAAGKTGTTDDYRDAYFVGYTPDIVTGVWVGDDNNRQMPGLTGGTVPARIWHDIMIVATEKYGSHDFDYPEIKLNGYGKPIDQADVNAESETSKTEDEEKLLKEANEVKEKAAENYKGTTDNAFNQITPTEINKNFNNKTAPVPKAAPVPVSGAQ
ncbi:MAG TPA: penicillin-binding protein [Cyanobacteria bacterium UBA11991]|nr:penicillin-binding protein [Cyanobacteria bacterium UBA11991]